MARAAKALVRNWSILLANALTTAATIGLVYWLWVLRDSFDSQLVVVWTAGSLVGLLATCWTLGDSMAERAAIHLQPAPIDLVLEALASANVRRESFRVAVFACPLWIGITVLGGFNNVTINRIFLLAWVLLLICNSLLDRLERHQTGALVRRIAAAHLAMVKANSDEPATGAP